MIDRRALLGLTAALALSAGSVAKAAAPDVEEIAYGDDPHQRLDVHAREGLRRAPVLVFVHGGGWKRGDKRMVNALPDYAERHGFLLVSINYRMVPQVDAGGSAQDVAAAAAWVRANIARFGGDPKRVFLVGHSAGAHLVALIGVDPRYLAAHRMTPPDLAGIVPVDGAGFDAVKQMAALEKNGAPVLREMYEGAFGARAAELSPTLLVKPGLRYPPFLLLHVVRRPDARRQSNALGDALVAAGGRAEVVGAMGKTHGTINRDLGKAGDPDGERMAAFIRTGRLSAP